MHFLVKEVIFVNQYDLTLEVNVDSLTVALLSAMSSVYLFVSEIDL